MEIVSMHEAKRRLSKLVARAEEGETVIIAGAGKPVVRITAADASNTGG